MELKLKSLSVCDFKKHLHTHSTVDADVIVPDTKPDIFRVLAVKAYADTDERYLRKDKIIYSGNVRFNIIYVGETDRKKLHTIEFVAPFNYQADVPGIDEMCTGMTSCRVSQTGFQIKNSRKLSVSASIGIETSVIKQNELDVVEDEEGEDCVPIRFSDYEFDCVRVCKELEIPLSEKYSIPFYSDSETEVVDVDVRVEIPEVKTVNNKAVIKGSGRFTTLCSVGNEINSCENELSFTEICDIDGVTSDMDVLIHFDIADCSYTVDDKGDEITIDVHYKLRGCIFATEHICARVAEDLYDPDYKYEKKESEAILMKNHGPFEFQTTVKDIASHAGTESEIDEIHFMNALCECGSSYIAGAHICSDVTVHTDYVYTDSSGSLANIRKDIPFKIEIPAGEHVTGDVHMNVDVTNFGYTLSSSSEIQTRIILKAQATVFDGENVTLITGFSSDKDSPHDKSGQPSIVVCYPSDSDSLWSLAKKYNTTCEEISQINELEADKSLTHGKPVIISKRKAKNL